MPAPRHQQAQTVVIIDAPAFDITVTESPNYKGEPEYLIRYGLEAKRRPSLEEAMREFGHCIDHAAASMGLELDL